MNMPALSALALLAWSSAAMGALGDKLYTRPGRLVDAGDGAKLNMYCPGGGSPAVVFDSGFEDWAPA